jgi:hypothetical protein
VRGFQSAPVVQKKPVPPSVSDAALDRELFGPIRDVSEGLLFFWLPGHCHRALLRPKLGDCSVLTVRSKTRQSRNSAEVTHD